MLLLEDIVCLSHALPAPAMALSAFPVPPPFLQPGSSRLLTKSGAWGRSGLLENVQLR